MRICGIDPGLRNTGWGIIDINGNSLKWVADGVIRPDPELPDAERLLVISHDLSSLLSLYKPQQAAIEEIFVAQSAASALKLGMARGSALIALAEYGLKVEAISARRVKQNLTGSGRADKNQVTAMVSRLLGVTPSSTDAADALAIAIAASHDRSSLSEPDQGTLLDKAIARALAKENIS
ncbi:crossover junction endodeoxyribonuclease RuvC [Alphaproteobacteria bacterium LSUCC0684]